MIDRVDELRQEGYLNGDTKYRAKDYSLEWLLEDMPKECDSVRRGELVKRSVYDKSKLVEEVISLASVSGKMQKLTPAFYMVHMGSDVSLTEAEYNFVVDTARETLFTSVLDSAGLIRKIDANLLYDFNTDVELLEYVRKTQDHSLIRYETAQLLLSMCVEYRDVSCTDIQLFELMRDSGFFKKYYPEADKYDAHRSCVIALKRSMYNLNEEPDFYEIAEMMFKSGVLLVNDYCHYKQVLRTPIEDMSKKDVMRMVVYCYFMYSHDVEDDIDKVDSKLSMCSLRVQHSLKRYGVNTDEKVYKFLAEGGKVRGLGVAGMKELKEVFTV